MKKVKKFLNGSNIFLSQITVNVSMCKNNLHNLFCETKSKNLEKGWNQEILLLLLIIIGKYILI